WIGTGLKMGGGMGGEHSVPKQSIEVLGLNPVRIALTGMAAIRQNQLEGQVFAGHWLVQDEFLISMAMLLSGADSNQSRN
ncbi:MAG: hypothetical protein ABJA67_11630, partial [Chthonomonadales bacterium]